MAQPLIGTTDIPAAGTAVQILASGVQVFAVYFIAREGNTGNIYVGDSDVSATNGVELAPGASVFMSNDRESFQPQDWYADAATNGDDIDYIFIQSSGN